MVAVSDTHLRLKDRATPHTGVWKHSLQYYCRPDGRHGVRVGKWNIGSQSGNGEKFVKN